MTKNQVDKISQRNAELKKNYANIKEQYNYINFSLFVDANIESSLFHQLVKVWRDISNPMIWMKKRFWKVIR